MTSTKYAQNTAVSVNRSRDAIETLLKNRGATTFTVGWTDGSAAVQFVMRGRQLRLVLPLPDTDDPEITRTPTGKPRSAQAALAAHEAEVKRRWRALLLILRAKLEAVETGIVTFEEEFLGHTVLPSGRTVAQEITPAVENAYLTGQVAPLQIEGGGR